MPCSDGGDYAAYYSQAAEDLRKVSAALCAVLTVLEKQKRFNATVAQIDWREAGLNTRWLKRWWLEHKQEDEERRERERRQANLRHRRNAALKKLTPEDREALGLDSDDGGDDV